MEETQRSEERKTNCVERVLTISAWPQKPITPRLVEMGLLQAHIERVQSLYEKKEAWRQKQAK